MPCLPGGLGTVKWIHIIRPCRSQSHSRGPTCHLRKDEASARTVQMGLYGWGMCPQGIAPSASIGGLRTTIRLQNDGSDCPQPRPTKNAAPSWRIGDGQLDSKYQTLSSPIAPNRGPTCHLRMDEAPARAVQMGLYGWGMCPQGIAPSASIGRLRTVK